MSDQPEEVDLWGNKRDVYQSLKDRLGVWPTTVMPRDSQDALARELQLLLGDAEARDEVFQKEAPPDSKSTYQTATSAWNAGTQTLIMNLWGPEAGALVVDPFAGGSRGAVCGLRGCRYRGFDISAKQVEANRRQCDRLGLGHLVTFETHDSRNAFPLEDRSADALITCPPYLWLEKYHGPFGDLSMMPTYPDFMREMEKVVVNTRRVLKRGAVSCWVTGLVRDDDGSLLTMHHDISTMHRRNGFTLDEEVIIQNINNGAITRVGMFDKGNHRLVRVHEYLSVYRRQ
jgi:hypothetical protein